MIAAVLWLAFAGAIILGLFAIRVTDRNVSWIAGIVATALLVGFSWLAGFTFGPFTIALPVLLTATVTSRGAPMLVRMLVIALAAGVYWLVTWPLLQFANWTLVLPALCAVAYVVAIRRSASARS
jgi:hypothetical protein